MRGFRHIMRHVLPVLLLALVSIGVTPHGYMPDFDGDGFSIRLCSGTGDAKLAISRDDPNYALLALVNGLELPAASNDHDSNDHHDDGKTMPPCAFAGMALALANDAVWGIVPDLRPTSIAPAHLNYILKSRHTAHTPPATGPPALV